MERGCRPQHGPGWGHVTIGEITVDLDVYFACCIEFPQEIEISLTHNKLSDTETSTVLYNGMDHDMPLRFETNAFVGQSSAGTWTLQLRTARYDAVIESFRITFQPASDAELTGEYAGALPDNTVPLYSTYTNDSDILIPGNWGEVALSSIEITEGASVSEIIVDLDVSHPYAGSLEVSLWHNGYDAQGNYLDTGTSLMLFDRAGGDLPTRFSINAFAGQSSAGTWTLRVRHQSDAGTLNNFQISFRN